MGKSPPPERAADSSDQGPGVLAGGQRAGLRRTGTEGPADNGDTVAPGMQASGVRDRLSHFSLCSKHFVIQCPWAGGAGRPSFCLCRAGTPRELAEGATLPASLISASAS